MDTRKIYRHNIDNSPFHDANDWPYDYTRKWIYDLLRYDPDLDWSSWAIDKRLTFNPNRIKVDAKDDPTQHIKDRFKAAHIKVDVESIGFITDVWMVTIKISKKRWTKEENIAYLTHELIGSWEDGRMTMLEMWEDDLALLADIDDLNAKIEVTPEVFRRVMITVLRYFADNFEKGEYDE